MTTKYVKEWYKRKMNPKTTNSENEICECGHEKKVHVDWELSPCSRKGCPCLKFKPQTQSQEITAEGEGAVNSSSSPLDETPNEETCANCGELRGTHFENYKGELYCWIKGKVNYNRKFVAQNQSRQTKQENIK